MFICSIDIKTWMGRNVLVCGDNSLFTHQSSCKRGPACLLLCSGCVCVVGKREAPWTTAGACVEPEVWAFVFSVLLSEFDSG